VRLIHPFPADELKLLVDRAKKVVVVENNATGQLANITNLHIGGRDKTLSVTKYDGTPFLPRELKSRVKELLD